VTNNQPRSTVQTNRIESLDSIRGIAALAVLLGHTSGSLAWPVAWTQIPFVNIFFEGTSAVTMFFVLSGFVLSRPYFASGEKAAKTLHFKTFYIRRITRIWIPWFFVFCISALAKRFFFHLPTTVPPESEWLRGFWNNPLTVSNTLQQCVFALRDHTQQLIPQDWSLGVELIGSFLIPFFILLARRNSFSLFVIGGILVLSSHESARYLSFIFGVLLAKYYHDIEHKMRGISFSWKVAALFFGLILYQFRLASHLVHISDRIIWPITATGCVLIILMSLCSRRIQKTLSHTVVVFLGRISYSVYLIQFIVLLCLLPPFIKELNVFGINQIITTLLPGICFSVLLTVLLATISYYLVEVPAIGLGRKLTKLIDQRH
jgi:peptidoglycan/LPS O-acetylase OafA/YrhL